jgi:hypothetical protein
MRISAQDRSNTGHRAGLAQILSCLLGRRIVRAKEFLTQIGRFVKKADAFSAGVGVCQQQHPEVVTGGGPGRIFGIGDIARQRSQRGAEFTLSAVIVAGSAQRQSQVLMRVRGVAAALPIFLHRNGEPLPAQRHCGLGIALQAFEITHIQVGFVALLFAQTKFFFLRLDFIELLVGAIQLALCNMRGRQSAQRNARALKFAPVFFVENAYRFVRDFPSSPGKAKP